MSTVISAKFTAVDKFSATINKMTAATTKFSAKAAAQFAKIERAERNVRKGADRLLGTFGKLGVGLSGLAVMTEVVNANIELDKSMASLSAITGVVGKGFDAFRSEIDRVSKAQKKFAGETAKAFEIVGSAKPELLGNAQALGAVTDAVITLSKASGDDLTQSALNLTGAMNQFSLGADQAQRAINVLAAGSQAGSANIGQINESLTKFGAVAHGANISLEQSVGLIETLAEKSLKGSDAGTALKGVILKLQKAGVGYVSGQFDINNALADTQKRLDKLKTAKEKDALLTKMFGAENIVAGKIILSNVEGFNKYTDAVTGTNVANQQAAINSATIANKLQEVKAAFQNAVTSTSANNKALEKFKNILTIAAANMDKIIAGVIVAIKVFVLYKAVMTIAAAVQWVMAAAVNGTLWPILAVIAAIAAIVLVIKNWGKITEWFSGIWDKFSGFIVGIWDKIVGYFKSKSLVDIFLDIGQSIFKFLTMPLRGVLTLISKLPGKVGQGAEAALKGFDKVLNFDINNNEKQQPLNPEATSNAVQTQRIEKIQNTKSELIINNKSGQEAELKGNPSNIKVTNTLGWQ